MSVSINKIKLRNKTKRKKKEESFRVIRRVFR